MLVGVVRLWLWWFYCWCGGFTLIAFRLWFGLWLFMLSAALLVVACGLMCLISCLWVVSCVYCLGGLLDWWLRFLLLLA